MSEPSDTGLHPPERGTSSAMAYFWASTCDLRLLMLVVESVMSGDFVRRVAQDALAGVEGYKNLDPAELARKDPGPGTKALRASSQELLEMFLTRAVDSFQAYIVDILREVLHKQPRILSASKQELTLGYVLEFDSIESLTRDWIEGKVASLSYEGFGDLEQWCASRGIPLVVPEGCREKIVELIATRNLIVHNRGVVDDRYIRATPITKCSVGDKRPLVVDDLFEAMELLAKVTTITDSAVAGKFSLSLLSLRDELAARSKERWPERQGNAKALLGQAEEGTSG